MKTNVAKLIIFTCMLASLTHGTMHAAVKDWIRNKKEQVRSSVQGKIAEARRTTSDLLATLQQNTNCLIRGTCPAEQKQKLRSLAKKIGVTVGVIATAAAVATAAAYVASKRDETGEPIDISQPSDYRVVSRDDIAKKYHVSLEMGESPQSLLLQAVDNDVSEKVKLYANNVAQNVLLAGVALAKVRGYSGIAVELQKLHYANALFLEKVDAGALKKVKELYCDPGQQISSAAVSEGINIAKQKALNWPALYQPIVDFLKNPICLSAGG